MTGDSLLTSKTFDTHRYLQAESQAQNFAMQLESLQEEIQVAEEAVVAAEQAVEEAAKIESEQEGKVGQIRDLYEEARSELDALQDLMANCSAEIVALKNHLADKTQAKEEVASEAKKLAIKISRIEKERGGAEKTVSALLKKYSWIESEKKAFGVPGGDYDFEATDPSSVAKQMKELKQQQEQLVSL